MNVEEKTLPERLKQTYSRSQLAPSKSVREKSNSLVCKKKKENALSSLIELSMNCGKSLIKDSELQYM